MLNHSDSSAWHIKGVCSLSISQSGSIKSLVSSCLSFHFLLFSVRMPGNIDDHNGMPESDSIIGQKQKHGCPSTLELGPRKKLSVLVLDILFWNLLISVPSALLKILLSIMGATSGEQYMCFAMFRPLLSMVWHTQPMVMILLLPHKFTLL